MVGRMVARVRPEVSRALHGGRSCRDSAVISPGRRGRCTPTRNFEAKKFTKSRGCMDNFRYRTLLNWSDTLGLKKREFANGAAASRSKGTWRTHFASLFFRTAFGGAIDRWSSVVLRRPISRGGTSEVRSFLFDRLSFPGSSSSKATRRWPLEAGLFFSRLHPSL